MKTATAQSSSLSVAMAEMTIFVVVPMTLTVQMVTFATRTLTDVLKTLGATTTTPCAKDIMPPATFQVMTTASTVMGKTVQLVCGYFIFVFFISRNICLGCGGLDENGNCPDKYPICGHGGGEHLCGCDSDADCAA